MTGVWSEAGDIGLFAPLCPYISGTEFSPFVTHKLRYQSNRVTKEFLMLVRLVGFQLKVEGKGNLTLTSFANSLAELNPGTPGESSSRRLLFLNEKNHHEYCAGLVVTVKDHRTYCELVSSHESLLVKVNELDHGSNLMDFNFFVFNKMTGAGLYQHYHQSCSANAFGDLAKKKFFDYKKISCQSALNAVANSTTEAENKKINGQFANKLNFSILVRKEALKALIIEMKRVKAFEYALVTPEVPQDEFSPLKPFIKMKSERLTFAVKTPMRSVADAIDTFVSGNSLQRGCIEAVDEAGIDRVIKIMNNPDSFGEYDFDDLVPKLNELNLTSFEQSWVITELISKCKENVAAFEYEVKS